MHNIISDILLHYMISDISNYEFYMQISMILHIDYYYLNKIYFLYVYLLILHTFNYVYLCF
jgi:hypothetical protein